MEDKMKTLKNLDLRVRPFILEGTPTEEQLVNEPTHRRIYRTMLAMGKGTPEQAVDVLDLQFKLAACEDQVELSDTEFNLLKERVRQNPMQLADFFWGQVLRNLEG